MVADERLGVGKRQLFGLSATVGAIAALSHLGGLRDAPSPYGSIAA